MQRPAFVRTALFKQAFDAPDEEKTEAEELVVALLAARGRIKPLLDKIPADCRDLTIHDLTHLDALWDIASVVVGGEIKLNPAEGFVLGIAVLVHDAGLTAASYPGGIDGLRASQTYLDLLAVIEGRRRSANASMDDVHQQALFATLRALHAKQAEKLLSEPIGTNPDGSEAYILAEEPLRSGWGRSIGRVAASHHWDTGKLMDLRSTVGTVASIPTNWTIDERKLAAILRVADIAHIDSRRAPSMHYALQKPAGYSELHWRFQNKINKPTISAGLLTYTSGTEFRVADAEAWWLAYETIVQIDREVIATNRLLSQIGLPEFSAKGVSGASSLELFAKYCAPAGWTPVDASIKVSNPKQLAAAIGGRNLYGTGLEAPLRELLQNGTDAIRARRALTGSTSACGRIKVSLSTSGDITTISVTDNGIGMSEEVMCGPLIDFGKSLWHSEQLTIELPGLAAKKPQVIGKYGIGFFSLFDVAEDIEVYSRRYDASLDSGLSLRFSGLAARPMLLKTPDIADPDWNTRITFTVKDPASAEGDPKRTTTTLANSIRRLVIPLDVDVEFESDGKRLWDHSHNVYGGSKQHLLAEIGGRFGRGDAKGDAITVELLQEIKSIDGRVLGLAALDVKGLLERYRGSSAAVISAQGFSSYGYDEEREFFRNERRPISPVPMIGILEGEHDDVSRRTGRYYAEKSDIQRWLVNQYPIVMRAGMSEFHLAKMAERLFSLGYDTRELPLAFAGHSFLHLDQLTQRLTKLDRVSFPVNDTSYSTLKTTAASDVLEWLGSGTLSDECFYWASTLTVVSEDENRYRRESSEDDEEEVTSFRQQSDFAPIVDLLTRVWGGVGTGTLETVETLKDRVPFVESRSLCLVIRRP